MTPSFRVGESKKIKKLIHFDVYCEKKKLRTFVAPDVDMAAAAAAAANREVLKYACVSYRGAH